MASDIRFTILESNFSQVHYVVRCIQQVHFSKDVIMDEFVPFSGQCACGDIQYVCDEAPLAMFNCHCKQCQTASGGAFVTVALVREKSLTINKGLPKYFRSWGDAGRYTDSPGS